MTSLELIMLGHAVREQEHKRDMKRRELKAKQRELADAETAVTASRATLVAALRADAEARPQRSDLEVCAVRR